MLKMNLVLLATFFLFNSFQQNDVAKTSNDIRKSQARLFLLSKGLVNDTLKSEFLDFLDREPSSQKVAIIVNATNSEKKKAKKTRKVKSRFETIGFDTTKIEMFDLRKRKVDDLMNFDIVYILGGNPFLLLDEVKKTKADQVLKKYVTHNKILMGYSAGALILGPNLKLMDSVDNLLGFNEMGLEELECLGFYDFYIFPHYKDFSNQVPELADEIDKFEAHEKAKVYRITDEQGIIYQNGETKLIGN